MRKIGKRFHNSDALQLELVQACLDVKIPPMSMIRPVSTRWNTYADVIPRAIYLRPALDRMLSQSRYNKGKRPLGSYKLSSVEWSLLAKLVPMLEVLSSLSVIHIC